MIRLSQVTLIRGTKTLPEEARPANAPEEMLELEDAPDLEPVRETGVFERVYRSVCTRVFPCERTPEAGQFDF